MISLSSDQTSCEVIKQLPIGINKRAQQAASCTSSGGVSESRNGGGGGLRPSESTNIDSLFGSFVVNGVCEASNGIDNVVNHSDSDPVPWDGHRGTGSPLVRGWVVTVHVGRVHVAHLVIVIVPPPHKVDATTHRTGRKTASGTREVGQATPFTRGVIVGLKVVQGVPQVTSRRVDYLEKKYKQLVETDIYNHPCIQIFRMHWTCFRAELTSLLIGSSRFRRGLGLRLKFRTNLYETGVLMCFCPMWCCFRKQTPVQRPWNSHTHHIKSSIDLPPWMQCSRSICFAFSAGSYCFIAYSPSDGLWSISIHTCY